MTTRCKFKCTQIAKREGWGGNQFIWNVDFQVVVSNNNNEENAAFFAATPSGNLTIQAIKADLFEVGKEYYLDITLAEK